MNPYISNIQEITLSNTDFRRVLFTGSKTQLVVMSLKPGEDIGQEIHNDVDQFFRIESGTAKVVIDGNETIVVDDYVIIIPAGTLHNIVNNGDTDLKLYTLYSPPNHPDGTVHKTKTEAVEYEQIHH